MSLSPNRQISRRNRVSDATEFKFLLGRATPSSELNGRLWKVLDNHPELYGSVLRYFQRYLTLPQKAGDGLVAALRARPRFGAVVAELIRTAEGRLRPQQESAISKFVDTGGTHGMLETADLLAAISRWSIRRGLLTASKIGRRVREKKCPWWTKAELIGVLEIATVGKPLRDQILNECLQHPVSDVAVTAAVGLATPVGSNVTVPHRLLQTGAARILQALRMVPKGAGAVCGIERYFRKLLGGNLPAVNWKRFFGRDYRSAERQAVLCSGRVDADMTAWVNAMDVFDDWLLKALFRRDKTLGSVYTIGQLGSMMNQGNFKKLYPNLQALILEIHDKRGESSLSHPVKKKGTKIIKRAGPIRYRYIFRAKKLIRKALVELAAV